jgi:hypothetical protein
MDLCSFIRGYGTVERSACRYLTRGFLHLTNSQAYIESSYRECALSAKNVHRGA